MADADPASDRGAAAAVSAVVPPLARVAAAPPRPRAGWAGLGAPYAVAAPATPLPAPRRLWGQDALAAELGLPAPWWHSDEATRVLAGNAPWPVHAAPGTADGGTAGAPLAGHHATAYAGHQFGRYTAQLGDGRALLLAELDSAGGPRELQLKGAGPTPYARGGDGRAVLRSALREALACEAMHALGVPTTRALALVGSPLAVLRDGRPETAAVLCRVAPSFLRFGHLEFHARQGDAGTARERLQPIADWLIQHHEPDLAAVADPVERHARWLGRVVERHARLTARWQALGFCHGVLNTDNCSLLGLTLDYGPFGFMDRFRAHHVANDSDHDGRYCWAEQPAVGRWNLGRLLDAAWPLLADGAGRCAEARAATEAAARARAERLLAAYEPAFDAAVRSAWQARLGLVGDYAGDAALIARWLNLLQAARADFHASFRALSDDAPAALRPRFARRGLAERFDAWAADWQARLALQGEPEARWRARMQASNPCYVLRKHLAQLVIAAAERGDLAPLHDFQRVLARPCQPQPGAERWAQPPAEDAEPAGVSCSS